MTDSVVTPPAHRGFGATSLALGILLVLGVALWVTIGSTFFLAIVWLAVLAVGVAVIIGVVHLVVAITATAFGVLAIVRDRGRVLGIVGLALTLVATAATAFVAFFYVQLLGVFGS